MHQISSGLPQKLDLHVPPSNPACAVGYEQLLSLLEELGRQLDAGAVSRQDLRRWESAAIGHLHDREIDLLMQVPDDTDFDASALADQRWKNLRSILLERKGLSRRAVEADVRDGGS